MSCSVATTGGLPTHGAAGSVCLPSHGSRRDILPRVNLIHRRYCRSDGWAFAVQKYMLPWVLKDIDLGDNALEIGPGPGRTTEWLRDHVPHLTAIEIDHALAES